MNRQTLSENESTAARAPSTRARRWLFPAIALGIGCLSGLGVAEVLVRLAEPVPDTRGVPLPGSGRVYGYPANSQGYAGGIPYRTNSSGFRGSEFTNIDSARDFIILVLGDSYAFGYGVKSSEAFPALLESRLQQEYSGRRIRVVNLATPGYETSQELAVLREWAPNFRPHLVLLQYHLNDIRRQRESVGAGDAPPPAVQPRLVDMKRHSALLRLLLPRLAAIARSLGVSVKSTATTDLSEYVNDGPAWKHNQETLQCLFGAAQSVGAAIGVLVVPNLVQLNDHHPLTPAYETVMRFLTANRIPAVNAFDYFKGQRAGSLWINVFDAHPNAAGHVLLAQAAYDLTAKTRVLEVR
jgi:lysophospholipase L1-like esterase